LLVVAGGNGAPSGRAYLVRENRDGARQTRFDERSLCRTKPVATGAINLARYAAEAR
jgi:hypothetical protein